MKTPLIVALFGFVALHPPAVEVAPGEFRLAPEEGLVLTREYEEKLHMELDEVQFLMNDEDMSDHAGDLEFVVDESEKVILRDEFIKVAKDRVQRLERTFETLTGTFKQDVEGPQGAQTEEADKVSVLEERTVSFAWDDDEEGYLPEFTDEDADDEELLDELRFDADMLAILPDEEVSKGDTWEADAVAFAEGLEIGGEWSLQREDKEEDEFEEELRDLMDENQDGTVHVTYQGEEELDGVRVAVFVVEADLETHGQVERNIDHEAMEGTESRSVEASVHYEGKVFWDVEGQHLAGMEFEGEHEYRMEQSAVIQAQGQEFSQRQVMVFVGESEMRCEVSAE